MGLRLTWGQGQRRPAAPGSRGTPVSVWGTPRELAHVNLKTALAARDWPRPHSESGKLGHRKEGPLCRGLSARKWPRVVRLPRPRPQPAAPVTVAAQAGGEPPAGFLRAALPGTLHGAGWGRAARLLLQEGRPPDLLSNAVVLPLQGLRQRLRHVLAVREGEVHLHAGVGAHPAGLLTESHDTMTAPRHPNPHGARTRTGEQEASASGACTEGQWRGAGAAPSFH